MWITKCNNVEVGKMRIRRRDTRIWFMMLGMFAMVFLFTFLTGYFKGRKVEVEAASLDGFDPGFIISDWQMGRYDAMNESEIQAFLTAKNPCGNRNHEYYLALTANSGEIWHWDKEHFVCLSEELFGDGEVIGEGETAAHVIWQAAQDYKINPQVLLVLLQKETGLITDPIPNKYDYRKAAGYGCPDTAPCSAQYYGFKNQIRKAASLFRTVLDGGWTNYPLGENYIQYNPSYECGGSVVNIRSLATSALYRYTPYQPNEGALAAGYGTAYCGAYGNRNFYLYFEDWFGGIKEEGVIENKEEDEDMGLISLIEDEKSHTLEDGTYQILSALSNEYALDIKGGVNEKSSSGEMILWNKHKDEQTLSNQSFDVKYDEETGYYSIINSISGLSLDVYGGGVENGTGIIAWQKNGACNQQWIIYENDNGYEILSACSGKAIDVSGGEVGNNKKIILYKRHGGDNQRWVFNDLARGKIKEGVEYIITTRGNDDMVMDISGGIKSGMLSGKTIIYTRNGLGGNNQRFMFKKDDETGNYYIYNRDSNLYLDVYGGGTDDGTQIIMWPYNGACNQQWKLIKDEGDIYTIKSACSEKVIDVYGGSFTDGTPLIIYLAHGGMNQQWEIKRF